MVQAGRSKIKLASTVEIYEVPVGTTIMKVLSEHSHEVFRSCAPGIYGTCMTGLISGQAEHRDSVLSEADHNSLIMICVSRARSDLIVLGL